MPCFVKSNYNLHVAMIGHAACEFNNRVILTGGMDMAGNMFGNVYAAKDGENFELLTTPAHRINPARYGHQMAVHDGRLYLTGGSSVAGVTHGDVWSTLNGKDWECVNQNAFTPRMSHAMFSFDRRLWVVGGFDWKATLSDCWNSTDGVHWQKVVDNYSIINRFSMGFCVYGRKMWMTGGIEGVGLTALQDCRWSVNGHQWEPSQVPADFPAIFGHTMNVFDNKMVIIGGGLNPDIFGNLTQPTLWHSSNGTDWALGNGNIGFNVQGHAAVAFTPHQRLFVYGGTDDTGYKTEIWSTLGDEFRSKAW